MHIVLEDDWTCIYPFRESSARRICKTIWNVRKYHPAIEGAELFRTKQIFGTSSRLWLGWCLSLHKTQNQLVTNVEEASGNTRWDYARGALNMRPSWALIHKCLYESQQHMRPTSRPKQSRNKPKWYRSGSSSLAATPRWAPTQCPTTTQPNRCRQMRTHGRWPGIS